MNRRKEIEERMGQIAAELKAAGDALTADKIAEMEKEVDALNEERAALDKAAETRAALLAGIAAADIAAGAGQKTHTPAAATMRVLGQFSAAPIEERAAQSADPHDTPEYRAAFMAYACRGTPIPMELRAGDVTGASDAAAVIPTATLNQIIEKMDAYGSIYARVRKLNIQGGVRVPVLSLKPSASWVGEGASASVKLDASGYISFGYFGLECKIAQTLLASVVTYEAFQNAFVPLATQAVVKALETAIFKGTGSGQATGITVDPRVPAANVITLAAADFKTWAGWKKNVFAKMKKAYRNGIFVMAQGTFDGYIDGMTDTTGQPIGRVNYGIDNGENYRFGGKVVETVEDDVLTSYDDAAAGDVVAVFLNPDDYAINSNLQMSVVKWTDNDTNEVKTKAMMICDGRLLDANGVIIVKKGS